MFAEDYGSLVPQSRKLSAEADGGGDNSCSLYPNERRARSPVWCYHTASTCVVSAVGRYCKGIIRAVAQDALESDPLGPPRGVLLSVHRYPALSSGDSSEWETQISGYHRSHGNRSDNRIERVGVGLEDRIKSRPRRDHIGLEAGNNGSSCIALCHAVSVVALEWKLPAKELRHRKRLDQDSRCRCRHPWPDWSPRAMKQSQTGGGHRSPRSRSRPQS